MIRKKCLALILTAAIGISNLSLSTVFGATVEVSAKPMINLEEIKREAVNKYMEIQEANSVGESTIYDSETNSNENLFKADDIVRVIVEMKEGNAKSSDAVMTENLNIQASALTEINNKEISFQVRYQFTEGTNTITGEMLYGDLENIKAIPGVESVRVAREYKTNLANANAMIQGEQVWEEYGYKGEGMAVAVLDTGFQIDHPDLVLGESGREKAKFTEENLNGVLNSTEVDDIYYNEKFPTGYDWANKDNDISPLDPFYANHGMHVAGIIGANGDIEDTGIKGIAPEVQIIGEKVFADDGRGYEDDIIAGINHAVEVGADVINMSLGSDSGFVLEESDLMQIAIKNASKAGVLVVVSAGNGYFSTADPYYPRPNPYSSNFDYGTVGDPSVSSYALSVASADNNMSTVNIGELSNGENIQYKNQIRLFPITTDIIGEEEYEVVKVDGIDSKYFKEVDCKNKVVLIEMSDSYFISGGVQSNAKQNGAVAVILAGEYTDNYNVDSYYEIPVVATSMANSEKILDAIEKDGSVSIKFTDKIDVVSSTDNIEMSQFSSWGTSPTLDFKPELTGIGGNVYSTTPDGEHTTMSGTSMAAPQVAGAAAILLQHMKENGQELNFESIMDAKAMLMNNTMIVEQGDNPYSPRKQGAGLLQLDNAIKSPVMIYDNDAEAQEKGAFELKEINDTVALNLAVENLNNSSEEYKVVVDLYTDDKYEKEIDINWDGVVDYSKDVTTLNSKKVSGANITINGAKDFTVKGSEEKQVVEINIDLSNANIDENSYVEGYIRLVPVNSELNEVSIPLMGFYGDWNDAPNVDEPMINGQPYAEYTAVFGYDSDTPLGFDRSQAKIIEEKVVFSPIGYNNLVGVRFTALRNLEYARVIVEDSEGNQVKELAVEEYLPKSTFYNRNIYYNFSDFAPWDGTNDEDVFVKDGKYSFVIESKFAYEGAEVQETKLDIKLDGTEPTVKDITVDEVEGGYEINFEVYDETSGFNGAIIYVDGEYIPLQPGFTSYIVENIPQEVIVIAFDNASNAGLGVYGDSNEISPDTLILYYSVSGEGVNYNNPASMFGAVQKPMRWNLEIVGPTGDIMYSLENYVDMMLYMEFRPEQGEPNGTYTVRGKIIDDATGIFATLEEKSFEVADNEIADKLGLYTAIMDARDYVKTLLVGDEAGQYQQEAIDIFNEVVESSVDIYYEPTATDEDVKMAIENIESALEVLNSSVNLSEGKKSAINLMEYCKELIEGVIIGTRPGNYGEEAYNNLLAEMEILQGLIDSEEEITEDEFNDAINNTNISIKAFKDSQVQAGETDELVNLIKTQRAYLESVEAGTAPYKYTSEAIEELKSVILEVEKTMEVELTVEEVQQLEEKILSAIEKFNSTKIDIEELNKAIEDGEALLAAIKDSLDIYDEEAVRELEGSIEAGKALLVAPHTTLEAVTDLVEDINVNIKKVKDSKEEKPVEPEEPVDPQEPTEPSNPDEDKDDLPQTGAMAGTMAMASIGLMLGAIGVVGLKKRNIR